MQSVGDSDPYCLVDHQIENLVGVQKRRLFRRDARILACRRRYPLFRYRIYAVSGSGAFSPF